MKQCVQCRNELPDTAAHCVFCGSKQPLPTDGPGAARTMMGHPGMADELVRQAEARGKRSSEPLGRGPVSGFDETQPLSNEPFRDGGPLGYGGPGGPPPAQGYRPPPGGPRFPAEPPPGYGPGEPAAFGGHPNMTGGPPPPPDPFPGGPPPGYDGPPMNGPGGLLPEGMYGGPPPGYGPGPGGPPPGYGPGPGGPPPGYGPSPGGPPGMAPGYGPGGPPPGYGPGPGGPPPGPGMYGGPPDMPGYGPGPGGPPPGYPGGPPPGYPGGPPPGYGSGPGGPPGMAPGYGPGAPPPGYGPGPGGQGPYGGPPPPGAYGPGGPSPGYGAYDHHPATEPVPPMRPPYLASESGRRAFSPSEPWGEALKTLMLVFGVLLVACFVAPWKVQPGQTFFAWTLLGSDVPAAAKIIPILLASTGVLAVVLGALPLATLGRGFAAAGIGLAPMIYRAVAPPFIWQELFGVVGAVTLISGLLIRSIYASALAGRVMATIGVVCMLVPLVIPDGGMVPLVAAFKMLGTNQTVAALILLVPALLALASLLVWLPPPTGAGALVLAWIFIVWPLAAAILMWLSAGNVGANLKVNLDGILYVPMATMAWSALIGYGVATVAGKQLELG